MEATEFKFHLGDIWTVAKDAIAFAMTKQTRGMEPSEVFFFFNEIRVTCYSSSEPRDIVEKYMLSSELRRINEMF